jgi:hypothetical protein
MIPVRKRRERRLPQVASIRGQPHQQSVQILRYGRVGSQLLGHPAHHLCKLRIARELVPQFPQQHSLHEHLSQPGGIGRVDSGDLSAEPRLQGLINAWCGFR